MFHVEPSAICVPSSPAAGPERTRVPGCPRVSSPPARSTCGPLARPCPSGGLRSRVPTGCWPRIGDRTRTWPTVPQGPHRWRRAVLTTRHRVAGPEFRDRPADLVAWRRRRDPASRLVPRSVAPTLSVRGRRVLGQSSKFTGRWTRDTPRHAGSRVGGHGEKSDTITARGPGGSARGSPRGCAATTAATTATTGADLRQRVRMPCAGRSGRVRHRAIRGIGRSGPVRGPLGFHVEPREPGAWPGSRRCRGTFRWVRSPRGAQARAPGSGSRAPRRRRPVDG
jgi:hypothetical protein